MKSCFKICCGLIAIAMSQSLSNALTTPAPATQPEFEKLTLHPSAATQPWTRYRLMASSFDQQEGNAVPFYLMAPTKFPDQKTTTEVLEPENHKYDYLDTPIEDFPPKYAKALLDAYADSLHYAEIGASRRDARWDDFWNVDWNDPQFELNRFGYLNGLRHVENLLSFRARLEIHQRRWPEALHTIQTMMAIAQHIGSEQVTIHQLVGLGLSDLVLARPVMAWISHDKSANLYWSLSVLPHPLVQFSANDADEDHALRSWRPVLSQAIKGTLPADQWNQALYEMVNSLANMRPPFGQSREKEKLLGDVDRLVKLKLDASRQALKAGGIDEATLNAMPPQQIVGMQLVNEYRTASANIWKSFGLPFPEAKEQMLRAWKEIAPEKSPAADNPLIQADLVYFPSNYRIPAALSRRYQMERVDRYIALLRLIEALRDFAASHDGRPPENLEAITQLPVPLDPMTGRSFNYEVHGQIVKIDATSPPPFSPFGGWRYELTFAR